jgi:hypothetical protein
MAYLHSCFCYFSLCQCGFLFLAAACKVNYDPSAGIDSDCNDVSGDLPSIQQNAEEEPSVPEQAVTVKVIFC